MTTGERPAGVTDEDARLFAFAGELWPVRRRASYAVSVDRERVPDWLRDAVHLPGLRRSLRRRPAAVPFATPADAGRLLRRHAPRRPRAARPHRGPRRDVRVAHRRSSPARRTTATTRPTTWASSPGWAPRTTCGRSSRRPTRAACASSSTSSSTTSSSEHPAFRAAVADRDGPEARWFTFTDWPDHYLSFFGVRDHPQLDTDDPGARDHLIAAGRRWLDLGVDGFRCDYANGPSHAFWSAFRAATRAASPGSVPLGEIVETPALQRTYARPARRLPRLHPAAGAAGRVRVRRPSLHASSTRSCDATSRSPTGTGSCRRSSTTTT